MEAARPQPIIIICIIIIITTTTTTATTSSIITTISYYHHYVIIIIITIITIYLLLLIIYSARLGVAPEHLHLGPGEGPAIHILCNGIQLIISIMMTRMIIRLLIIAIMNITFIMIHDDNDYYNNDDNEIDTIRILTARGKRATSARGKPCGRGTRGRAGQLLLQLSVPVSPLILDADLQSGRGLSD